MPQRVSVPCATGWAWGASCLQMKAAMDVWAISVGVCSGRRAAAVAERQWPSGSGQVAVARLQWPGWVRGQQRRCLVHVVEEGERGQIPVVDGRCDAADHEEHADEAADHHLHLRHRIVPPRALRTSRPPGGSRRVLSRRERLHKDAHPTQGTARTRHARHARGTHGTHAAPTGRIRDAQHPRHAPCPVGTARAA